jgi:ankyrin repeat protein
MNIDNISAPWLDRFCNFVKKCRNVKMTIMRGHIDCLTFILNHGNLIKHINEHDAYNQTALTFSITHRVRSEFSYKIFKLLIEFGADVNIKGPGGNTPLQLCIIYGKKNYLPLLFEKYADPNILNRSGKTCLDLAISEQEIYNTIRDYVESYNSLDIKEPSDD